MKPSRSATLSLGRALGAATLLFAGCKGLGATGGCAVEGDCGGNPTGIWQVTETCSFPVVSRPAQDYATPPYFEPETGATPPAVTSGSWCWDLTFDKDGNISSPAVPMAAPDIIQSGTITFSADHSYVYSLTATSTTNFHVAYSCFGVNGAGLTCAQFAMKLQMSAIGANPVYGNTSNGSRSPFRCDAAGDGCDCAFDYVEADQFADAVGDMGTWQVDPGSNVIHQYSSGGQGNLNEINPSRRTVRDTTFCVTDGNQTLQLSGTNGMALALKAGSRSLTLTRMAPPPDASATGGAGGTAGDQMGGGAGGAGGAGGQTDAGTD